MSNKKVSQSKVTEIIDTETGEVKQTVSTKTFGLDREPPYIKMYIDDIARLKELPQGMNKILMELIKSMGYNNVIPAYKPIKMMICESLDIKMDYLNKAISTFHKKGLLIRLHRGIYIADPELFARGKWEDIQNLRLVIEYSHDGTKKVKGNLPDEVQLKLGKFPLTFFVPSCEY